MPSDDFTGHYDATRFHLDEAASDLIEMCNEVETVEDAVMARALMEDMKSRVSLMTAEVDSILLDMIPRSERFGTAIEVPGGGVLKFTGDKEVTRYDHDRIKSQYARAIVNDLEGSGVRIVADTGEVLDPEEVVGTIVDLMTQAVGVSPSFTSWRSGVAKKYGIDVKAGATLETTKPTVRIEGRNKDNG